MARGHRRADARGPARFQGAARRGAQRGSGGFRRRAGRGCPGPGGAGAVIYKNGLEIWSESSFVGKDTTNNISEYTGLIKGLNQCLILGIKNITVNGDSQLVIKQMKNEYKVNSENLIELHKTAKQLEKTFDVISYNHVYRKDNKRADQLSNEGLLKNVN